MRQVDQKALVAPVKWRTGDALFHFVKSSSGRQLLPASQKIVQGPIVLLYIPDLPERHLPFPPVCPDCQGRQMCSHLLRHAEQLLHLFFLRRLHQISKHMIVIGFQRKITAPGQIGYRHLLVCLADARHRLNPSHSLHINIKQDKVIFSGIERFKKHAPLRKIVNIFHFSALIEEVLQHLIFRRFILTDRQFQSHPHGRSVSSSSPRCTIINRCKRMCRAAFRLIPSVHFPSVYTGFHYIRNTIRGKAIILFVSCQVPFSAIMPSSSGLF